MKGKSRILHHRMCKLNQHAITIILYCYNVPVITYVFPMSSCTPHAADEVVVYIHTWEYLNGLVYPLCENWSMKVQEIMVFIHWCKRYLIIWVFTFSNIFSVDIFFACIVKKKGIFACTCIGLTSIFAH